MSAEVHSKVKHITKFINVNRVTVTKQEESCDVTHQYIESLLALGIMHQLLTLCTNEYPWRIKQALLQMQPNKSPGPDKFNPVFY